MGNKVDEKELFVNIVGHFHGIQRDDEIFVKIVEDYISKHQDSKIFKIVEIPKNVKWNIASNDCGGGEFIEERHRTWC